MGIKIKTPKIKTPKISNPIKEVEKGFDKVADKVVETTNTVVNQTTNVVNTVVKSSEDIAKDVVKSVKDIAVGPVYQAYVDTTKNAMKTAKVATEAMDDIEAGAKLAVKGLE